MFLKCLFVMSITEMGKDIHQLLLVEKQVLCKVKFDDLRF